jgi:predicted dienelactone hydrolase
VIPALLALSACTPIESGENDSGAPAVDPLAWDVAAPGPYGVGYRIWETSYELLGQTRTIQVQVWYPTDDTDGEDVVYTSGFPDPDAFLDASLADPVYDGGYPVMAYSHGWQGYGGSSAFLMRHHASHGWVVVAPDHTGNTLMDHRDPLPTSIYVARPSDITVSLDELDADAALGGRADTSRVVLSGHSFGAYTTWSALGATFEGAETACDTGDVPEGSCTDDERAAFAAGLRDPRVVATIPLAGNLDRRWFGATGELSVGGPVLFMGGTMDDVGQVEQFDQMGDIDFTWVELEGGCHQTFGIGTCGSLDTQDGYDMVDTYALAFSRKNVLGDTSVDGILDGSVGVDERAVVRVR